MKNWISTFIIVGVAIFAGNYIINLHKEIGSLTEKVTELQITIALKDSFISNLTDSNLKLKRELTEANNKITTYVNQVTDLEAKKSNYTAQIFSLQTENSDFKKSVTALQTDKSALTIRIDRILRTNVIQHYNWLNYFDCEITIPLSLYFEYKERPRPTSTSSYVNLAKDSKDDDYIEKLVQLFNTKISQYNFNERQKLNFIVAFVQSLPYTVDSVTTLADEYPRYPIETLFDRGGDCEDTSILTAAILDHMGYDVALINPPKHMAVGIALPYAYGRYYNHDGKKYFYLETTGQYWEIGEMPEEYINQSAYVYPLR